MGVGVHYHETISYELCGNCEMNPFSSASTDITSVFSWLRSTQMLLLVSFMKVFILIYKTQSGTNLAFRPFIF